MFWCKNGPFSSRDFLGNIGQENVFYDILHRKNAFVAYKTKTSKSGKTDIFPKGLTHSFRRKLVIFPTFFLGNIGKENVFYDILEQKNFFLAYKNKKFKKSKNSQFCNGVNPWFWSKNSRFSTFCFLGNLGQENVFYNILERKNAFLGYKNKKFKKSKN